jgi:hypothetical protein
MSGVLLGRLYALREQLDAVIDAIEHQPAPAAPKDETSCDHPPEKRKYAGTTMGEALSFTCEQCNTVVRSSRAPNRSSTASCGGAQPQKERKMAHFQFIDGRAELNTVNLSAHVTGMDIPMELDMVQDGPCMGQTRKKFLPVIISDGPIRIRFKQDYANALVHQTLNPLLQNKTDFAFKFRPTTGVVGPTNPEVTGSAYLSHYDVLRGEFGDVVGTEAVLTPGATAWSIAIA